MPSTIDVQPFAAEQLSVGRLDNNAYLLALHDEVLLIDAAAEASRLLRWIGSRRLVGVVTTHSHHDHIGALAEVVDATGATAWCGTPDAADIQRQTGVECETVWTGDAIRLGTERLGVLGLVGHTPGSITLVSEAPGRPTHLFTGDSLFPGGVGKTGSADDFASLFAGVRDLIFGQFDDDTVVHPGHGEATTLGAERGALPEWQARGW